MFNRQAFFIFAGMRLAVMLLVGFCGTLILSSCGVHRQQVSYGDKSLARLLQNDAGHEHTNALVVYDPLKRTYLFEKNADLFFTPASNTKIATLCAALHHLRDSTVALKYISRGDSLVFWGAYDPAFLLDSVLRCQRAVSLLETHGGPLVYAPQEGVAKFGPGWAWDDYNTAFQAERSALPMYGNKARVTILADGFYYTDPPYFRPYCSINPGLNQIVRRSPDVNAFEINPEWVEGYHEQVDVPFICSPYQTMELLADTLGKRIDIVYGFDHQNHDYSVVNGEPVDSLYRRMMQESDNFIAEQLLLQCQLHVEGAHSSQDIIGQMLSGPLASVSPGFRWYDGSGLSRYNLMTPRSAVLLLEHLLQEKSMEYLQNIFPAGGVSGTIADRFGSTQPYVFAKSGTLKNNYALSGYLITSSGRLLIFSSMHSNFVESTGLVKDDIEITLKYLHDNF